LLGYRFFQHTPLNQKARRAARLFLTLSEV